MYSAKKQVETVDYIIYIFSLFYLFVDTVAGFLSTKGIPNLGQPYKILLIFLMIFSCVSKKLHNGMIISFLFSVLFWLPFNYLFSSFANFNKSILTIFKLFSNIIFIIYFTNYNENNKLLYILKLNYWIFIFNIFAGVLGFAASTYENTEASLGSKGFFIAGNEVTYTFLCLTFFMLSIQKKHRYIVYGFSFIISVLIATKACMIGTLLLIMIDIFFNTKRKNRKYIITLFIIFIFISVILIYYLLQDSPMYQYIAFKIRQHSTGSHPILNGITSGRIERIMPLRNSYNSYFSILTLLCGIGFPLVGVRLEMDFLEIFYYFGTIILLISLIFYFFLLYKAKVSSNMKLFFFNLVVLLISFIAGHIVYSVMGGLFFAIVNTFNYEEELPENKKLRTSLHKTVKILFKVSKI